MTPTILEIPVTSTPMTISVSIKGVTHLTEGQYKRRHSGSKDILQQPIKGFITKKQYFKENKHEIPVKKKKRKVQITNQDNSEAQQIEKKVPREKSYMINKKEVTHRILNYVNQMKGEKLLYLWTVTFPKKTKDEVCYKLLNVWLTRLRQEKMLKSYLWITERQQNGTIHYHLAINNKMNVVKANKMMRGSIMYLVNKGDIEYNRTDAAKYNGVDISKNRKTRRVTNFALKKNQKQLSNYLTKYISKSGDTFKNLAWHNSRDYSNLIIAVNMTASEFFNSPLRYLVNVKDGFEAAYFVFFRWQDGTPQKLLDYLAFANQTALSKFDLN